jgi:hypothetical protein
MFSPAISGSITKWLRPCTLLNVTVCLDDTVLMNIFNKNNVKEDRKHVWISFTSEQRTNVFVKINMSLLIR